MVSEAVVVLSLNDKNGDFLRATWVSRELEDPDSDWDATESIDVNRQTQRVWPIKSARLDENKDSGTGS